MTITTAATCLLALADSGLRPSSEPIPKLATYEHDFVLGYSRPGPFVHDGGVQASFFVNDPGPIQISLKGDAIVFRAENKPEYDVVPNIKVPLSLALNVYPIGSNRKTYQMWQPIGPVAAMLYVVPDPAIWSGFDMDKKESYNRWAVEVWQEKTLRMGMKGRLKITAPYPRYLANEMPKTVGPNFKDAQHLMEVPAKVPGRYLVTGHFEFKPTSLDPTKPPPALPIAPPIEAKLEILPAPGAPAVAFAAGKRPVLAVRAFPDFVSEKGRFMVRLTTSSKLRPLLAQIRAEWIPDRPTSSIYGKFTKN